MTITGGAATPQHTRPLELVRGVLAGGVIGVSLAAFVVGIVLERVPLLVGAPVLPAVYGLLVLLAGAPARTRARAVAPRTSLAVIESREVARGETTDVPVTFEVTVAPDEAYAFRVRFRQDVNVADLPDYRPRDIVVVAYPPDEPWKARIVQRPTPEWEERAAGARLDPVPGPVLESDPAQGCATGFLTLVALLLGAAAVVYGFRGDLFDSDSPAKPSTSSSSSSSSSSNTSTTSITVTVTSSTGTVALGPGQSMLDPGELRRSVESLAQGNRHRAITVVVQERLLTVAFSPGDGAAGFDPRSLPFDRVPALVEEAGSGLGAPRVWRLTADGAALQVTVTGRGGTKSLEADGKGTVVRRG
ncbi:MULTISPECIES: hypothetical protein [unclassified Streptomyces]|uniref:hypothetical protein n=1 Tax=unclassified Streptomyces TaxID=2593676 RepID=UPI000DD9937D|nr:MULTISPECIES: hypothetical protein [unclassified Streptomyces]QZZ25418.1 hypothetical protein A7X85_03140 [Streptomyces sp. ST1015]